MLKHVLEPPPSPRTVNANINAATEQVVLRALTKSPDDRFARAVDLADALERSLDPNATLQKSIITPSARDNRLPMAIGLGVVGVLALVALLFSQAPPTAPAPESTTSEPPSAPLQAAAQLGDELYDDFNAATIDAARWAYTGTFTATLNSDAVAIQNGRLTYQIENATDEYYDGGARAEPGRAFSIVSVKVTLLDAGGNSDIGIQVNGIDGDPTAWAYLAMFPSDATVFAFLGHFGVGTEETFTLLPGTGMPATHELAIGWDGAQITFYVDGQPRKSIATQTRGQWFQLLFDVEPQGRLSGSFDDVRVTYED
jgi:hypothetical protein